MGKFIRRFLDDDSGAISVEYGATVSLIGAASAMALAALGDAMDQMYESVTSVSTEATTVSDDRSF